MNVIISYMEHRGSIIIVRPHIPTPSSTVPVPCPPHFGLQNRGTRDTEGAVENATHVISSQSSAFGIFSTKMINPSLKITYSPRAPGKKKRIPVWNWPSFLVRVFVCQCQGGYLLWRNESFKPVFFFILCGGGFIGPGPQDTHKERTIDSKRSPKNTSQAIILYHVSMTSTNCFRSALWRRNRED